MRLEFREADPVKTQAKLQEADDFFLYYSSFLGGYTRDRLLMSVPIDDHIVHRGDGVFDNTLCLNGNYYLLDRHLERFFFSANAIGIYPSFSQTDLKRLLIKLGLESGKKDFVARYFVSRGHGSMSVYPHEAISPNLYILICKFNPAPERYFTKGMVAATSPTQMRPPISPQVKSVDYLSNVLMELAAKESGADSAIAVDASGNITEGSNKNVVVIGKDGMLRVPPPEKILRGTTLVRALEMSGELVRKKIISGVRIENIPISDAYNAAEMLFFSTSFFVAPIVKYDGRKIGDGKPGKAWKTFHDLFLKDIKSNKKVLTPLK
ncbi:MAG: aminotransferase class IV [Bacteroidetes bacterium]|nr:aminotransferase class IV [Bacteroidota bacterium]